ncbi:SDR family oxidoreductase [Phytohabitans kaempferiae]|uniref:SDR family oxidoreductase n=1 Tax=Phytohabitans kaempferiae TaxID=1620943 RepID=A0ABV6MCP9_9ACTN
MRIAIAGGTGTLGSHVTTELRSRGHEVRVLSRRSPDHPVDLTTGEGLEAALAGCVVVDATNASRNASAVLVEGSRRLLAAEAAAGVGHHVCASIVGCDQVPLGYFKVKADQERVVAQGPVPWTTVRITQFHELVAATLAPAGRWRLLPVPNARPRMVAVAEAAGGGRRHRRGGAAPGGVEVAGPEFADARQLARTWRKTTGHRALLLPVPLPGRLGQALRNGVLAAGRPDVQGVTPFGAWLAARP